MSYTTSTASEFKARHPRFAALADGVVDAYLGEAALDVVDWSDTDGPVGIMLLAAHLMVEEGAIAPTKTALGVGNQIKKVKAGEVETEFATERPAGISGKLWATYGSTVYGRRYLALAARNTGPTDAVVLVV